MLLFERLQEKRRKELLLQKPYLKHDIEELNRNGYIIIKNVLSESQILTYKKEADNLLLQTEFSKIPFEGHRKTVCAVVAKTRAFDSLVLHQRVLDICDYYLFQNYLLAVIHLLQVFKDTKHQTIHQDAGGYLYAQLPSISKNNDINPLRIGAIWAIDDFTENNGSTLVIPKSHLWSRHKKINSFKNEILKKAVMPKGSVLVYFGSTFHAAGQNITDKSRLGVAIQYVQPWIRPQENNMFALPLTEVDKVPKRLKQLIGYSIYSFGGNTGMVDGKHPNHYVQKLLHTYKASKL